MNKKVLITGATGQDGSFMAEYLLANTENTLILAARRTSQSILGNLKNVLDNPRVKLITLDLMDGQAIRNVIKQEKPDYFINLGAQTFVADSWEHPIQHMQINAISLIHILEAVREYVPQCRVYSAGSSEQMGDVEYTPQDMMHPFKPRSIYGVSKCTSALLCKVYRESYGLYVVHGILYNHESERRQEYFVTRKITKGVACIKRAIESKKEFQPIELGNLDAKRDWSHAEDFVDGIWRMLNQEKYNKNFPLLIGGPILEIKNTKFYSKHIKEYILASGETHSIREFVELAFKEAGIEAHWVRYIKNLEEFRMFEPNGNDCSPAAVKYTNVLVKINPKFYRPADVEVLCGDSFPARKELGWNPKISLEELIQRMVKFDLENF